MSFDPDGFLRTAQTVFRSASSEADYRTVAGRCYYAAYGYLRGQVCAAKGVTPDRLFGKKGRHAEVAGLVSRTKPFRVVAAQYNGLLTLRAHADYTYSASVSRDDAAGAVRDAEWLMRKLRGFREPDFRSFPLT